MADEYVVGAGGGRQEGGLGARVSSLEVTLHRIDIAIARMEVTLATLATKADLAEAKGAINALTERVSAQEVRLTKVETALDDIVKTAVGKAIGPWQLPAVLAASGGVIVGLVALLNWIAHQAWFGH